MSDDGGLWLLAAGPVGATALYWVLYRYYRNTDKSHAFERETDVQISGTQRSRIEGDNVGAYRARVQRISDESS